MAENTRVLEFSVGDDTYCIDIHSVDQVIPPGELNESPNLPEEAEGVMTYRDTTIEVWDAAKLLSNRDAAMVERRRELDAELAEEFDDMEATIETLLESGGITSENDAETLISQLQSLREEIVSGPVEMDEVIETRDVIVLAPQFQNEGRRVGWLVNRVEDVRIVTRDDLDDSVGGDGVYGVLRPEDRDEDEEQADVGEEIDDIEEVDNLTIWVDTQSLLND